MRTLSLLRHAKSSWDDTSLPDFDRPLAPRGRKAAPAMARHMHDIGLKPDLLLCSAAVRTRETAALVYPELGLPTLEIRYDRTIYEAHPDTLLARLAAVTSTTRHVLLIGHNPGLQELALLLCPPSASADYTALTAKLPTAALVVIELSIDTWVDLRPGVGRLTHFMTPKRLASG